MAKNFSIQSENWDVLRLNPTDEEHKLDVANFINSWRSKQKSFVSHEPFLYFHLAWSIHI